MAPLRHLNTTALNVVANRADGIPLSVASHPSPLTFRRQVESDRLRVSLPLVGHLASSPFPNVSFP
jgi:hypothetical protein